MNLQNEFEKQKQQFNALQRDHSRVVEENAKYKQQIAKLQKDSSQVVGKLAEITRRLESSQQEHSRIVSELQAQLSEARRQLQEQMAVGPTQRTIANLRMGEEYSIFLSHHKQDAAETARLFKVWVEMKDVKERGGGEMRKKCARVLFVRCIIVFILILTVTT